MEKTSLSASQAYALLDILSHHEVYEEIRDFRKPGILEQYGPPFTRNSGSPSTTPSLQTLTSRFLLTLPGLRDVSKDFWQEQCYVIIENFEKAELSESYDRGAMGIRKTLTTAISALIEYPLRGILAGLPNLPNTKEQITYDTSNPTDLSKAFRDFLHQIVYADMLDELVEKAAETDQLSHHSSIVQAAHEYVLLNLASLMHFALILSPKGQNLLSLIDHANKLVPYAIIKQTLRIGNVASMINAMMKVVLAKMSVGSVTNWMGFTSSADEGMNLLQYIISTVLHWDIKDLKSRSSKIEKNREGLEKSQEETLQKYTEKSRDEHEKLRNQSMTESRSIVSVIFSESGISEDISESQHKEALEYLAIHLSIRDRLEIIKVLCHGQPDHLTTSLKEVVGAYEPVIRSVHKAVDLSDTVTDFEHFLKDLLYISRLSHKNNKEPPTVGDFVLLLRKHQTSCHKFLHQCAKNGKEVTGWFHDWARKAAGQFYRDAPKDQDKDDKSFDPEGAGAMTDDLIKMFDSLSEEQRENITAILDEQVIYLTKLHEASMTRLTNLVNSPPSDSSILKHNHFASHLQHERSSGSRSNSAPGSRSGSRPQSPARSIDPSQTPDSDPGPGAFLARWQALLDDTPVTPDSLNGKVRYGKDRAISIKLIGNSGEKNEEAPNEMRNKDGNYPIESMGTGEIGLRNKEKVERPDVGPLLEELLPAFKELLARKACDW